MTLGPFHIGDQPGDPVDLVVSRPGDAAPLSGVTVVTMEMERPDGTATNWPAVIQPGNIVRAPFPAGSFTQVGQHKIRAHLTGPGIDEVSSWSRFWVRPATG